MRILLIGLLAILVAACRAHAQTDWEALRNLPKEANLDIRELGGHGHTEGRLLLVEDTQLTILREKRAVVVPRAVIGRIQHRKSDPIWGGFITGILFGTVAHASAGEGCYRRSDSACLFQGVAVYGALGAFIDWRIQRHETVYIAPKRVAMTLFQMRF